MIEEEVKTEKQIFPIERVAQQVRLKASDLSVSGRTALIEALYSTDLFIEREGATRVGELDAEIVIRVTGEAVSAEAGLQRGAVLEPGTRHVTTLRLKP